MPTYLTVQGLLNKLKNDGLEYSEKTIRRWIDEGKDIRFDNIRYVPKKDPGGAWYFIIINITASEEEDSMRHPAPFRTRRRIISSGIK